MPKYKEIDVHGLSALLASANDPIVLDIRDAHSYREEHMGGAMLSHDGLIESLIKRRDFNRLMVIYCYHGNSSKDLAEFLSGVGFKAVYSLAGGYVAWKKRRTSEAHSEQQGTLVS